jgi:hypothetical protein
MRDTYIFDDVQVLRTVPFALTGVEAQDVEIRATWNKLLNDTVDSELSRQLAGDALTAEREWLETTEWTTDGIRVIGHLVGTDAYRSRGLMQRAQDAVADIKAMIASGLAGTAQFTMLIRSMQFRLSHNWKAHPARLCADAARVADQGIVHWFESMLPPLENPAEGLVHGEIGSLRETIIFTPENLGGIVHSVLVCSVGRCVCCRLTDSTYSFVHRWGASAAMGGLN